MGLLDAVKGIKPPDSDAPKTSEVQASKELVQEVKKSEFEESAEQLEKLRDGRDISDIPLNDPYYLYRNAHMQAHNKQTPRVDALPNEQRIQELENKGVEVIK